MKAPKRSRQNTPEQPIRRGNSRTDAFRRHLPARTKGRRQRAGHQTFCWSHELQRSFIRLTQPKRCMRFPRMTGGKRAWRPGLLGRSIWGGGFLIPLHHKSANNHTSGPPKRSGVHQDTNASTGSTVPAAGAEELMIHPPLPKPSPPPPPRASDWSCKRSFAQPN